MEKGRKNEIHEAFNKCLNENPQLLNSSKGKEITVYLGNTSSGKSTLINYLSDIELIGTPFGEIELKNINDSRAMKIGHTCNSETTFPKFIKNENIVHFDFPGFADTRGEIHGLINGCFMKNILENAEFTRIILLLVKMKSQHQEELL